MNYTNSDIAAFYGAHFDFGHQHKTHYRDWLKAFAGAIAARAVDGCFMGLSSGYDSGAISNELLRQGIRFKVWSIFFNENAGVLAERLKRIPEQEALPVMDAAEWKRYHAFLNGRINEKAMRDHASMGVAAMFDAAARERRSVCISGQGGDEIISDYALYPSQSTFKGVFPAALHEWPNFRGHMQEEYLNELEDIAALYGIEVRYPFLDVDLVQEFLWLAPELKNRNYKAPLHEYLTLNGVPFEPNVKRGFNPLARKDAVAA